MNVIRRKFRVERDGTPVGEPANTDNQNDAERRHQELMSAIAALRSQLEPTNELNEKVLEDYKKELGQALKLKTELDEIYEVINQTKQEIATLHHSGSKASKCCGSPMSSMPSSSERKTPPNRFSLLPRSSMSGPARSSR